MKFGAIVLAYKQEDYISYCLRSLSPYVDHVVVLFSHYPWIAYNPRAREEFTVRDRTGEILQSLKQQLPNLTILEGIWDDEDSMRNRGLEELKNGNVEVCVIVDSDELYPEGGLDALKSEIRRHNTPGTCYFGSYKTCYKRFDYIVESNHQSPVAVHCSSDTIFLKRRQPSGRIIHLSDEIFFWHMGYVLSDERMIEKIRTFGHAHELVPDWYEEKWLKWSPAAENLFRKNPASRWPRSIKIDAASLPRILHSHPFYPRNEDAIGSRFETPDRSILAGFELMGNDGSAIDS